MAYTNLSINPCNGYGLQETDIGYSVAQLFLRETYCVAFCSKLEDTNRGSTGYKEQICFEKIVLGLFTSDRP